MLLNYIDCFGKFIHIEAFNKRWMIVYYMQNYNVERIRSGINCIVAIWDYVNIYIKTDILLLSDFFEQKTFCLDSGN